MAQLSGTQKKQQKTFVVLLVAIVVVLAAIAYIAYGELTAHSSLFEDQKFAEAIAKDLGKAPAFLKESDLASLRTLGGQLGYLDVAMQKKTLDYYLEQVSDACAQAKKEYREKEKMFRCLGFGAGAFLVILLY